MCFESLSNKIEIVRLKHMADNSALGTAIGVLEKPAQAVQNEAKAIGQTITSQVTGAQPSDTKRDEQIQRLAEEDQRYVAAKLAGNQAELGKIIAEKEELLRSSFQNAQRLGAPTERQQPSVQEEHKREEQQTKMAELEERKKAPKPLQQSSGRGEMRGGRGVGG